MVDQAKGCVIKTVNSSTRDPIVVKVGEKFEVSAEENPSTGFVWLLLDQELEFHGLKGVIRISNSKFDCPKTLEDEPILVGSPGTRIFEIEALSEG